MTEATETPKAADVGQSDLEGVVRQERPKWCPHHECLFKRRVMDDACAGHLPKPEPHDTDFNHHRLCLNGASENGGVFDLQVNNSDLWWLRWLFDSLDGKNTANMPNAGREPGGTT